MCIFYIKSLPSMNIRQGQIVFLRNINYLTVNTLRQCEQYKKNVTPYTVLFSSLSYFLKNELKLLKCRNRSIFCLSRIFKSLNLMEILCLKSLYSSKVIYIFFFLENFITLSEQRQGILKHKLSAKMTSCRDTQIIIRYSY